MSTNIPMVICGRKLVNTCEKCGYKFTLAAKGQKVRLGEYVCPSCGEKFRLEVDKNGTLFILLPPIDNTKM